MRRYLTFPLLALLLAGCGKEKTEPQEAGDILRPNRAYIGDFEVARRVVTPDKTGILYEFTTQEGVFSFDIDMKGTKYRRVMFRVRDRGFAESVCFQRTGEKGIDLHTRRGVKVERQGMDCVVDFQNEGIDLLREGGRFLFIDNRQKTPPEKASAP